MDMRDIKIDLEIRESLLEKIKYELNLLSETSPLFGMISIDRVLRRAIENGIQGTLDELKRYKIKSSRKAPHYVTPEHEQIIVNFVKKGLSYYSIGKKLNFSNVTVARVAKSHGVKSIHESRNPLAAKPKRK